MVQPSCPALVIHPDDAFRRALVIALDQENFSVGFADTIEEALAATEQRKFRVIFAAVGEGGVTTEHLDEIRKVREAIGCGVILLTDPDPQRRAVARWADETFLKPVDAAYVVTRAKRYCSGST